jgi:hypothetical protein
MALKLSRLFKGFFYHDLVKVIIVLFLAFLSCKKDTGQTVVTAEQIKFASLDNLLLKLKKSAVYVLLNHHLLFPRFYKRKVNATEEIQQCLFHTNIPLSIFKFTRLKTENPNKNQKLNA